MRASWRSGAVAKDLDCTSDQLNAAAGAGNSKIEAKTRIGNRDSSFKMFEKFRIFDLFGWTYFFFCYYLAGTSLFSTGFAESDIGI